MKSIDKSNAKSLVFILIACFFCYLYLDYKDIPSKFNIGMNHINDNYLGIVVNVLLVIILYIISYYAIEKTQRKKDSNAKEIAAMLLKTTYKECLRTLELFVNEDEFTVHILPKIKHGLIKNEKNEEEILNKPFVNNNEIMHLAESGYISKHNFQNYLNIRNRFNSVISSNIFWMYEHEFEEIDNTKQKQKCLKETEILIKNINFSLDDLADESYD